MVQEYHEDVVGGVILPAISARMTITDQMDLHVKHAWAARTRTGMARGFAATVRTTPILSRQVHLIIIASAIPVTQGQTDKTARRALEDSTNQQQDLQTARIVRLTHILELLLIFWLIAPAI